MNDISYIQVLLAVVLVALSIAVSRYWKIPVAKDMAIGSVRSFIQLVAVGYALEFIFDLESLPLIALAILVMMTIGSYTAAGRVKLRSALPISLTAIVVASLVTLGVMIAVKIIPVTARYLIPLAGMIISNAMNTTAVSMERLVSDLRNNRLAIETSLSLGKSWREATHSYQRAATMAGMIAILNFMKTVGIVALPGAMTGMILGGADPLEAVLLQVIVGYMLLSTVTLASVVAVNLTVRRFFTTAHQFIMTD